MDNTSSSKKENFFLKLLCQIVKPTYKKNEIGPKLVGPLFTLFITGICFKCGKNIYEWYVRYVPNPIFSSILVGYAVLSIKTWIKALNNRYSPENQEKRSLSQLFVTYCFNYPLILFFSYLSLRYIFPAVKGDFSFGTIEFVILGLIIGYLSDAIWNKRNSL